MLKKTYETVVIGGGIIGCSIAYYLAKEKMDIAVMEAGKIGAKTTSAAAGMLGAHSESNDDFSVFYPFAKASQAAYIELKEALYEQSGIDIGYREGGILKLVYSQAEKQNFNYLLKQHTVEWLDEHRVKELEPSISSNVLGATYIPDDVNVLPDQTCHAFIKSAQANGASFFENNQVFEIVDKGGNYLVKTAQGEVEAKYVVLATGVYGNNLFHQLGLAERVSPVKGESLIVSHEQQLLKHTLFHNGSYIVPRNNGKFIIGATMMENDWSHTVSLKGADFLIKKAKKMLSSAGKFTIEGVTAGLRPTTFDRRPFIGVHPEQEGIFIATGHYRNGILLAPATGQMIRDFILGKEVESKLTEAFRLDRRQHIIV
ncbi:glycine oxidase ThiO [Oceanobacillus alkalisoli]|uniref:glycine oxidase ThiO n=1 Tax=Oceanobacillus alkalisoli TaxID=2925113 RepID=UPI001EE4B1A8|nr:glycine oxidase ThiO [Oceanobacillus alkalisoli]MCG5105338.1 glycine oxidase ThiO [Oceanobacillus alkalisoli]